MIIPFFLHPTPCYLILQWHSPSAKKTKKACLLGCTQQIVTKLKLLLKEGKKEPMHVFCSHSKPYIYEQYPSLHLIQVVPQKATSSLLFKSTKLLSPPTHQLYKCSALSRMNLRHTCSRVNSPQAQVADALSMLESVTESNIPTSCSNCRPRRTKSTTYNYYKGEGEG